MEVLTEIGSLVLRVYILRSLWTALYAQNAAPINLPLHGMITYATVAMLMSLILEVDGTRLIREKVREGTIATDLMKPISLPLYFFSDGLGQTLAARAARRSRRCCSRCCSVHIDVPPPADVRRLLVGLCDRLRRQFFPELPDELHRVLDARDVRGAADRALGLRSLVGPDHPAHVLSGHPRPDRLCAAVRGDLLDAAADLRRRDSAGAVGGRIRGAGRVAGALCASRSVVWRAASNRVVIQGG